MKLFLLVLASLTLSLTPSANLKKIQGTWKASAGQMGATNLPKPMLDKIVLILKGDTYDYDEGNGHDLGTLREVGDKPPLGLDIVGTKGPNKGRTYLAIYKLERSVLTICYGLDGHRPKSFDAKGTTLLMRYHRAD